MRCCWRDLKSKLPPDARRGDEEEEAGRSAERERASVGGGGFRQRQRRMRCGRGARGSSTGVTLAPTLSAAVSSALSPVPVQTGAAAAGPQQPNGNWRLSVFA